MENKETQEAKQSLIADILRKYPWKSSYIPDGNWTYDELNAKDYYAVRNILLEGFKDCEGDY